MQFQIPCDTFVRLSKVAVQPDETDHPKEPNLRSVRIEHRSGNVIASACNGKILSVEHVGTTTEPDGAVHVGIDPKLIEVCRDEIAYNSELMIAFEAGWATANTTFGYFHPDNVAQPDWLSGKTWRDIVPKETPTKANGTLAFNAHEIARLGSSAPSGSFVFPRHIDKDIAVVVRDKNDDSWIGVFLVLDRGPTEKQADPATVPEWVHR